MSELNPRDQEAIRTLKSLYTRRADAVFCSPGRASAVALAELFTHDGILDLGPLGRFEGQAALLDAFENVLPQGTAWSVHYITNPLIDGDGDGARGSWYFLIFAQARAQPPAPAAPIWGAYADRYERTDGVWKIAESIASYSAPAT